MPSSFIWHCHTLHEENVGLPHSVQVRISSTRMWANAQRDGRPAEYRRRPLCNAAKFDWRPKLECRAVTLKTRNPLKFARVPQTWDGAQMATFWRFLRAVFSASRAQHVSDLHCKFTLRPHRVSMVHRQSPTAEIKRGKKRKKERRNHRIKIYMACPIT